jgi:hypothetical protein
MLYRMFHHIISISQELIGSLKCRMHMSGIVNDNRAVGTSRIGMTFTSSVTVRHTLNSQPYRRKVSVFNEMSGTEVLVNVVC